MPQISPHTDPPPDGKESLLEYAHHHHIAEDALTTPANAHLSKHLPRKRTRSECNQELEGYLEGYSKGPVFSRKSFADSAQDPSDMIHGKLKLSVSIEEGRLLSTVMQNKEVEIDWNAVLPPLRHGRSPIVEYPLLTEEQEIRIFSKAQPLLDNEMIDGLWDETVALHEGDTTKNLQEMAESSTTETVEKLDCGTESLALTAELHQDCVLSPEETQLWFDSVVEKYDEGVHCSDDTLQRPDRAEEARSPSPMQLVPLPGLGNLSSFMSTRGVTTSAAPNSPYSAQGEPVKKPDKDQSLQTAPKFPEIILNITTPPVTPGQDPTEKFVCFLSTVTLKCHLSHVRSLDNRQSCRLIYRDYDSRTQPEADIIISAKTGIILTSAQSLTQKYLPGSKGSRQDIVSPIMERIYLTAPRYETVYIFICVLSAKADKQLQDAVTSLSSFCDSLSEDSTVIPMIVSGADGAVTGWVEYLSHTELSLLLPVIQSVGQSQTREEITLREYGLNPFAACLVLGMGNTLEKFIKMGAEKRRCRFGYLLGERVLRRVGVAIEREGAPRKSTERVD
ncbi:uncharacterized protein N7498_008047 [Penicillium cinerascens]|uniref:Uncharacterized protein n=1 Tax=Penicillium cinerascens TaxID=70096 RepID=A0A9W9JCP2_9EURO|nr:uncharacterized protein N7498_008047 [Penicillium cinerascens]KAJ5194609.1 hypothetical protein N7498_008047 [Penicillium cinerascens]